MGCYHPIPAHQDVAGGPVRLWPPLGTATMELPCGGCLGCRSARALEWSRRCMHEASLYQYNSFVTLTYDDEFLPDNGHLDKVALQAFVRRLRKASDSDRRILRDRSKPIRFFACGEYGEKSGRPHYHLLLFNCSFDPLVRIGERLFTADVLSGLWRFGLHTIGEVSGASANYVAQYSLKKQGVRSDCDQDGVVRPPPFLRMSLKPGIGSGWLSKYASDLRGGFLVVDGVRYGIPRFYRGKLKVFSLDEVVDQAVYDSRRVTESSLPARRLDAEKIHESRNRLFTERSL